MKLHFPGTGAAIKSVAHGASVVLDEHILFDAPPALNMLLKKANLFIDTVFITHLHGDHFSGLPFWLLEKYVTDRERKVCIYGPTGLREKVYAFFRLVFSDVDLHRFDLFENVRFHVFHPGEEIRCADYTVTVTASRHSIPAYGLLVRGGQTLYVSGDTELTEEVRRAIAQSDVVVMEATAREGRLPPHTTLEELMPLVRENPEKKFFITHRQDYSTAGFAQPNLFFPEDGETYSFPEEGK